MVKRKLILASGRFNPTLDPQIKEAGISLDAIEEAVIAWAFG